MAGSEGGGPSRNRTGVRGFAVPYVTTPPSGLVRRALAEPGLPCQPLDRRSLSTNGGSSAWPIGPARIKLACATAVLVTYNSLDIGVSVDFGMQDFGAARR